MSGSQDSVISYLAKEVVEDSISDNLGQAQLPGNHDI